MTELVLYQTVHLHRDRPRNLPQHVALLDDASREIFRRPYTPELRPLAARIESAARAANYPRGVSAFVRLELTEDGERLQPAGASLYDGYALRTLTPDAAVVTYDLPFSEAPTSVRASAALLARQLALHAGARVAVHADRDGVLRSADDAPLFGIRRRQLIAGPAFPCVERDLVLRAAHRAGIAVSDERLTQASLPQLDELFYADHRGITSLAHCDSLPLMSLLSERIAEALEGLFHQM